MVYFMPLLIALLEVRRTKYRWLIYAIFFGLFSFFFRKSLLHENGGTSVFCQHVTSKK